MKEYKAESIRNIALVSHSSAGKTMMAEACLHFTGATTRLGKVEDGTTVSDFDEEEARRNISVYTSVIPVEYKDVKLNLLDTPGYTDFVGEVVSAMRVCDAAAILVDPVSGREVGTEIAWNYCDQFNLPRVVIINKMDRENANFQKALDSVNEYSEMRLIPVQLPWGEKQDFQGVIDLLSMKAYKGVGQTGQEIPAEYQEQAETAHMVLIEVAAEGSDALMEKYFENGDLSTEDIILGLKAGIKSCSFAPVFAAAAGHEIGVAPLLDALIQLMPSPAEMDAVTAEGAKGSEKLTASDSGPLAVYVWKTTADPFVGRQTYFRVYSGMINSDSRVWNISTSVEERLGNLNIPRGKEGLPVKCVHAGDIGSVPKLNESYTGNTMCDKNHPLTLPVPVYPNALYEVAVFPKTQADSTKISPALTRLCEEDMTLSWHNEHATKQTILQGMGDQHIDAAIRRAASKLQVNLTSEIPKVPFQETINGKGEAMYRHKKQSGGSGQFGEVSLRVEPLHDEEFEFVNAVFGGSISSSYMPAIEKGVRSVMKTGILAGFPIHGIKVSVFDGKEHPVDSKPVAFEIAGRNAFKLAFHNANPVLLEPIMNVKVTVPEAMMGDIMGDMNTRRGRVMGVGSEKGKSIISAQVPLSEMLRYTTDLRSMTGGRGIFDMEYDHHEVVPAHITADIVSKLVQEKEEE